MNESPARILVADDDPRMLDSLRELIAPHGHEVGTAGSGAEAIAMLERRHFDVLLLDLMMPGVNGLEVMDFVNKKGLDVSVIVVSGDTSVDSAIRSLRRGAHDYLRKPYAPEVLIRTLENTLKKRMLERENRTIQGKLQQSEKLYRYMVNSSPDIIYMLDQKGRFTFINARIEKLLGYRPAELIGQHYSMLVPSEDMEEAHYAFNERRTGERASRNVEMRLKCRDRARSPRHFDTNTLPIELSAMGMYVVPEGSANKHYVGTYGVARDITERKHSEEIIRYQAFHDLLTGLPNRALFKDRLKLAIPQARRRDRLLAVMFLDLDRFKVVNDTLGHVRGDELLQLVATRLTGCMREGDTIARVGGDEFMILIPHLKRREDAAQTARKIIGELDRPFMLQGREVFVSTSIGIALCPDHGDNMDVLIRNADIAMYHIKEQGRDGYEFFDERMKVKFSHFLSLETGIRKALEENRFELRYQPLVDTSRATVVGVEALIRWHHPTRGMLAPAEFIPHAEECGLIVPIGNWVLEQACADLKSWREASAQPLRLAINLSALQLAHDEVDSITAMLAAHGIPGDALELELTENVIMKDIDNVVKKLNRLSKHGVRIAIDDFGTGYSSLSYLQKLPIHTIKIDRSFVNDMRSYNTQTSIVNAVIAMARGLGMNLIAEGVETSEQLAHLRALGCEVMQGFLFSEPLPAPELMEALRRGDFVAGLSGRGAA